VYHDRLLHLLKVQAVVIGALMMRELHTRFGRENLGYLWIIGEPIMFCGGVTIAWTAMRPAHEHGLPMTAMVLTGYVPLTMWRHALMVSAKAFQANGSLLFHRQVTPLDIITARVLLEILGTLASGIIVYLFAYMLGYMQVPKIWSLIYIGLLCHAMFSLATGLLCSALSELSELVEKGLSIFGYLSLPFTGAFAMVSWLPHKLQRIIYWSPSSQSIEMIRGGQFGWNSHPMFNFYYAFGVNFVLILIGLVLLSGIRKHIDVN